MRALCMQFIAVALVVTSRAHADDLWISTADHLSWSDVVAALRRDVSSEGRTIRIVVRERGIPLACELYSLRLDTNAADAFFVGPCDRTTGQTPLVLVHREALFDRHQPIARATPVAITAIETTTVTEVASGEPGGGSALMCSVAVRPYLADEEHGTRIMLTPDRYTLRPLSSNVSATPSGEGWSLTTTQAATLEVQYDVIDSVSGDVVLHERTTLTCATGPADAPRRRAPSHADGH